MAATYTGFRDELLVALAQKTERDGLRNYGFVEVADEAGLSRQPSWVEMARGEFKDLGYIQDTSTLGGDWSGILRGPGLAEAERLRDAAERVVHVDRDSDLHRRAVEALETLAAAVRASNEYRAEDPEDQEQRAAEVEAASKQINSARVRVAAFAPLAGGALRYLVRKFADSAMAKLAGEAIEVLRQLGLFG